MNLFNLRVYGILINENREILLSDEFIRGNYYTKFPGGGLEFGEGTRECLVREFREEMDLAVMTGDHIYTTDYYQRSAFNPQHQIISVYYYVHPLEPIRFRLRTRPFDFNDDEPETYKKTGETETFRFVPLEGFEVEMLSLPIDRIVAGLILR